MKRYFVVLFLILVYASVSAVGQVEAPKFNFNIGGGFGLPQGNLSNFANMGGNFVAGGGLNLGQATSFNGEFMWQDMPPKSSIVALTGAPDGSARTYSLTGNLMFHSPEAHHAGAYIIGGGGWYHRSWELTRPSISVGTVCLPSYAFWGVVCDNGLVESTTELNSGSNNGFGWNVGAGVTFRLGESHTKLYSEVRYHVAYYDTLDTRILPVTFGVRW